MATIIYLHGFASKGTSAKSAALISEFRSDQVYAPDLPIDPDDTIKVVSSIVHAASSYPIVFVGTSLGGFWANYFAQKFDANCVIVNPSVAPEITMASRVGQCLKNYATGDDIVITHDMVTKFQQYKDEAMVLYNGALVNLFLAKDDDIIDYRQSLEYLKYYNSLTLTEDGGHRYDTKWDTVVNKVKDVINCNMSQEFS